MGGKDRAALSLGFSELVDLGALAEAVGGLTARAVLPFCTLCWVDRSVTTPLIDARRGFAAGKGGAAPSPGFIDSGALAESVAGFFSAVVGAAAGASEVARACCAG